MRVGFETNVFIYSFDHTDPIKHARALLLMDAILDQQTIVPMQVISETLNASHKKRHLAIGDARLACEALADTQRIEPALPHDAAAASRLAEEHRLQFFDAQIIVLYARLGVTVLFSEDLQNGLRFGTLQIVNPFDPANDDLIRPLLTPAP